MRTQTDSKSPSLNATKRPDRVQLRHFIPLLLVFSAVVGGALSLLTTYAGIPHTAAEHEKAALTGSLTIAAALMETSPDKAVAALSQRAGNSLTVVLDQAGTIIAADLPALSGLPPAALPPELRNFRTIPPAPGIRVQAVRVDLAESTAEMLTGEATVCTDQCRTLLTLTDLSSAVQMQTNIYLRQNLQIGAALIAFALLTTLWARETVTKRVDRILESLNAYNADRSLIPPVVSPGDEIGDIAEAVTRLFSRIKTDEADLRRLMTAMEQAPISVLITDEKGIIEYANPAFTRSSGYQAEEVTGRNIRLLRSGCTSNAVYKAMWEDITAGRVWSGELNNRRKDGSLFWEFVTIAPVQNEHGDISHFLALKEDISLRKEYEEKLLFQSHHDDLTGLPNRVLATDRLTQAVEFCRRRGSPAAVLLINLDHLSGINESLGFSAGDSVLKEIGARLQARIPAGDVLGRMDGDTFVAVLSHITVVAEAEAHARALLEAVRTPLTVLGRQIYMTASIGISVFAHDGDDAADLLRNAGAALVRAKEKGGNCCRLFTPGMDREAAQRQLMEGMLRKAISENRIAVHYQPLVRSDSGHIVGAEALVRWVEDDGTMIPPDQFIPLAELNGLILPIGEIVLKQACRDAAHWRSLAGSGFFMAINVAAAQCESLDFLDLVSDSLNEAGLPAHCLEVEITERTLVADSPAAEAAMESLRHMGCNLSIDDFGTGYSALSYLRSYPFTTLKIDKSFVAAISDDQSADSLVLAIIRMAHALGLEVIAEGVETREQEDFLRCAGAQILQGYRYSRPVPAAEFTALLERQRMAAE